MSGKDYPPAYNKGPQQPQPSYQQPGPYANQGYYQSNQNMGYYPQQGGYPQYGPPQQQQQGGYYPPQQGHYQGGYPPPQSRTRSSDGCLGALLAAVACCCCLDCIF